MISAPLSFTALALLVLLVGCAHSPDTEIAGAIQPPKALAGWSVAGKAALTQADSTRTVSIHWQHTDSNQDQVLLSGPLGAGALELRRRGTELFWLDDGLEQPLTSLPMHSEARSAADNLPLISVSDWLLGYPEPVDGWSVAVTEWQQVDGWRVPRRIKAHRDDVSVKLVLLNWQLSPPT